MSYLLSITLDGLPPTVNHAYRTGRNVRYKTAEAKEFQRQAIFVMNVLRKNKSPYTGPVGVEICFTQRDHRPWDVDNRIKILQDCLAPAGVIKDDKQVVELYARREHGEEDKTHIIVRRFE